jgi:phosphoribosylamine--glycine ligase
MNILILGSGGREHALAWAVKQNPKCDRLIVAPGNAGHRACWPNAPTFDILSARRWWLSARKTPSIS